MKIAVYNQTITHKTGGTESYTSFLLKVLQKRYPGSSITIISEKVNTKNYTVEDVIKHINKSFNAQIENKNIFLKEIENKSRLSIFMNFYKATTGFDLVFNCSVNQLCPNGKTNISITHFPDKLYSQTKLVKLPLGSFVAKKIDKKIKNAYLAYFCNSKFTAGWLKKLWNENDSKIKVLYPPVKMIFNDKGIQKQKIILVCSRIEESKKIHFLIEAFKKLKSDYKLVIAGSCTLTSDKEYLKKLQNISTGFNVEYKLNLDRKSLEDLFNSATIFWHSKGFGISEEENPYMLEHFGITTSEAMSAGCIPVVINKAGQKEIVDEGVNGYKWDSLEDLIEKTESIIKSNDLSSLSKEARKKAHNYSIESFEKEFNKFLDELKL